jgi:hypothetical protein
MFAIAVGTSPTLADVSVVLFTPPTVSICRGVQQRNKATMKLGYLNPDEMYAAVASRGGEKYKVQASPVSKRGAVSKAHKAPADAAISSKHAFVPAASSAEKDTENSGRIAESDRSQHSGASCDHKVACRASSVVVQKTAVMSTCSCTLDVC